MLILGFDTATSACSAALWRDGAVAARRFEPMQRGQSERLMPMIQEVMDEAGAAFADLDLVAVTNGPGAFTGLRIGLAAARGLALAGNVPCLGVTTFEAIAAQVPADERRGRVLLVAIDAKRADVYVQVFDAGLAPAADAAARLPADVASSLPDRKAGVIVAGDGTARVLPALQAAGIAAVTSTAPGVPDAAGVCALAAARWRGVPPASPPLPLYLLAPSTTPAKARGRPGG